MKTIGNAGSTARKLKAVASGALPNGDPVVVNADGTVSVVSLVTVNTPSLATRYTYGGTPLYNATVYDSNSNKVVIAYEDRDLSTEGTAIVGTVSGETITFGTPVSFSSGGVRDVGATFDSTNNKVIIAYNDSSNSSYGTAVVGTVSGTSISFGSNLVFESNATYNIHLAYDSNSDDVVIAYRANIASNQGKCAICSVSGTSLLRSDTVTFTNKISTVTYDMDIGFDSNLNKFLIVYKDEDNSNYGTARVGTISGGTTLSLGTPVVFNAGETSRINLSFDTSENRFLLIYNDVSDNSYGKARVATISGSSVSFGTEVTFFSNTVSELANSYDPVEDKTLVIIGSSTAAEKIATATISGTSVTFGTLGDFADGSSQIGSVYDPDEGKVVFAMYSNDLASGSAAVGKFTSTSTNLTSENYVGLASNGYPDTAGATIDVQGAINDRQSGLTAGQSYYVQTDGTLSETAGTPSVFAGTAISATKMIVKG